MLFSPSTIRKISMYRLATSKRQTAGGINYNKGALSSAERGDSFTQPEIYRNSRNITSRLRSGRKVAFLQHEEKQRNEMRRLNMSSVHASALRNGTKLPNTPNEMQFVHNEDEEYANHEVRASSAYRGLRSSGGGEDQDGLMTVHMRKMMQREAERRNHTLDSLAIIPSAKEFSSMLGKLRNMDTDNEEVEEFQRKLVEEHGIYPSSRMEAYMLDDDSYFPEWVHALPFQIRDRVKYGNLGLTEEDEVMRIQLGRMSRDRRMREWKRIQYAKEYKAAHEEKLSVSELRNMRMGRRRYYAIQHVREKRASLLRKLARRKPDSFELVPSNTVDYSQRIAFIAQHVENGVHTHGQWPLDPEILHKAKIRRKVNEAERTFLMTAEEKRMISDNKSMQKNISDLLNSFDTPTRPFKKLSRKNFAHRVNAITLGDQDEYGRNPLKITRDVKHRHTPYQSFEEMSLEKEVRKEPVINFNGQVQRDVQHWPLNDHKWNHGMPSPRQAF